MLSGLRACRCEPQRGQRGSASAAGRQTSPQVSQPTAPTAGPSRGTAAWSTAGAGEAARLHLLPDRLPVEDGVGHDRGQHQRAERVERRADLDVDEVDQLHVGDEDAEQVDLDHRPGAQVLEPGEEPPQVPRRAPQPEADEHVGHGRQAEERRDGGGEEHDERELPEPVPLQALRPGEQVGAEVHAAGADGHEGHEAGDAEHGEGGEVQRQRPSERIVVRPAEHGIATQAAGGGAGAEHGHHLELAAVRTFPRNRRHAPATPHQRCRYRRQPPRARSGARAFSGWTGRLLAKPSARSKARTWSRETVIRSFIRIQSTPSVHGGVVNEPL